MHRAILPFALLATPTLEAQSSPLDSGGLVVVTPKAFADSLEPYLAHRRAEMPVRVLVFEEVDEDFQGVDAAERLKRAIYAQWRDERCRYVLLVGDADRLPVRYMMLDRIDEAAADVAFYGSDLYFGDVAKRDGSFEDWNARRDSVHGDYFGEVHGERNKSDPVNFDSIDYLPELGVGRWPVSDQAELAALVDKSIRYERGHDWTTPRRAALLHVPGWVDASQSLERIAESLRGFAIRRHGYGNDAQDHRAPAVEATWRAGIDLLVHSGHGSPEGYDQSIGLASLKQMESADRLPIVLSAGCSTAYFATLPPYEGYLDVTGERHAGTVAGERFAAPPPPPSCMQPADLDRTGFGERAVLGPGGAIAYFGCNTGGQPCGLTLVEEFAMAIGSGKALRLGDAWRMAVTRYHERERLAELVPDDGWYPPSIFFQAMKYPLFGDPSLMVQPPPVWQAFAEWVGAYEGELHMHSATSTAPVNMRLTLEPRDHGHSLRFAIEYGQGETAQLRDYLLVAGPAPNRFRIDERNGIVLDALLHDGVLTASFGVAGQVNVASYSWHENSIDFRLVGWSQPSAPSDPGVATPLPLLAAQRAQLRRRP
jgi:hypothetical protein